MISPRSTLLLTLAALVAAPAPAASRDVHAELLRRVPRVLGKALPAGARAAAAGATHVLFVALERSDYPVAQQNLKGEKAVALGTGNTVAVPWLTSLDQPAEVIHFTGALYRADGRFVRAGAEAFHAVRTPFGVSALEVQRSMGADDLEAAFRARRDDLPGAPEARSVALANLVAGLTGRAAR